MSVDVFSLQGSIDIDIKPFEKAVKDAKKQGQDLGKSMQANAKEMLDLQKECGRLANELSAAQDEIQQLKSQLGASAKAADENADSTADMTAEMKKAKDAMDKAGDSAEDLGKEESKTADKTDDYSKSADNARDISGKFEKAVSALGDTAKNVGGHIGDLASKIRDTLVKAAEVGAAAIGAASTAVAALATTAVNSYGEYEQLVGGVDTLFGEASDKVKKYADEAYKTAGMSANDYMQTVTSFSASLIQATGRGEQQDLDALKNTLDTEYNETKRSLQDQYDARKDYWDKQIKLAGNESEKELLRTQKSEELKIIKRANEDSLAELKKANSDRITEAQKANNASVTTAESLNKAAELANQAIIDMSDNANKMGTDMQSIQNAYQGFAKQNYTMLDNLKIGYGGTKEEMERLLSDAEALSGMKYNISSYADIVEAIHVIQEEMGISGTTAAEAAGTIQGSTASMKAAWQNLVTGLARPDADLGKLIDSFVDSASASINNLLPVIQQTLKGISKAIQSIAPVIAEGLPDFIASVAPDLFAAGVELLKGIGKAIATAVPILLPQVKQLLSGLVKGITGNAGTVITLLTKLFTGFTGAMRRNLPVVIQMGKELVTAIFDGFKDNLPEIWNDLQDLGSLLMDNVIKPAWNFIIHDLPGYINSVLTTVDFYQVGQTISNLIKVGLKGLADFISEIDWEQVGKDIARFINGIDFAGIAKALANLVWSALKQLPDLLTGFLSELDFNNFMDGLALIFVPLMLGQIRDKLAASGIWSDIGNVINNKFGGADGKGGLGAGAGSTFIAALEAFWVGWQIGTEIYNHFEEEINGVLFPIFDKIKAAWNRIFDINLDVYEDGTSHITSRTQTSSTPFDNNTSKGSTYSDLASQWGVSNTIDDRAFEQMYGMTKEEYARRAAQAKSFIGPRKNALGGIMVNSPVLTTSGQLFGEAGREAILPLDSNTGWMDGLADKLSQRSGQGVVVQTVNINMEGMKIASDYDTERFVELLSERLQALSTLQTRQVGGVGW